MPSSCGAPVVGGPAEGAVEAGTGIVRPDAAPAAFTVVAWPGGDSLESSGFYGCNRGKADIWTITG